MEQSRWPSVSECLEELQSISDRGGFICTDAYKYIYETLEGAAFEDETPPQLRELMPAYGPKVVRHILEGLETLVTSAPLKYAEQAMSSLSLMTTLLNDERCCRALEKTGEGHRILEALLDLLRDSQRLLIDTKLQKNQDYQIGMKQLGEMCMFLLLMCVQHKFDMSHLPEHLVVKVMDTLKMAVDSKFGPLPPVFPAQAIEMSKYLFPRLAPNHASPSEARGLLQSILIRALNVPNPRETELAYLALSAAEKCKLLKRDPHDFRAAGAIAYCKCIRLHFKVEALNRLAQEDLMLALQFSALLLRLLSYTGLTSSTLVTAIWATVTRALPTDSRQTVQLDTWKEALNVWKLYIKALQRDWVLIERRATEKNSEDDIDRVFENLPIPVYAVVRSGKGDRELNLIALRIMNILLSTRGWGKYLWKAVPTPPRDERRESSCGKKTQGPTKRISRVIFTLLGTQHHDRDSDPGRQRFETGLLFLLDLVPGSIPPHLLSQVPDHASRKWQVMLPPSEEKQRELLIDAAKAIAQLKVIRQSPPSIAQPSVAIESQASQDPSPPPEDKGSLAEQALMAIWSHLLRMIPDRPESGLIDSIFSILRGTKGEPQFLLHNLADEALIQRGNSEVPVDPQSKLWNDVVERIYTPSSSSSSSGGSNSRPSSPVPAPRLGVFLFGLKGLLLRPCNEIVVLSPLPPSLSLSNLVPFLEGLLKRLLDSEAGNVPHARPFLFIYYDTLTKMVGSTASTIASSEHSKVMLKMLPSFALCQPARELQPNEMRDMVGGQGVVDQWSNFLNKCLNHTNAEQEAWLEQDLKARRMEILEVMSPMIDTQAAGKRIRLTAAAVASLWYPLASAFLRNVNTILLSGGMPQDESNMLVDYSLRVLIRILQITHDIITTPSSARYLLTPAAAATATSPLSSAAAAADAVSVRLVHLCVCGFCGAKRKLPMFAKRKLPMFAMRKMPSEWGPRLGELAQALALWWMPLHSSSSNRAGGGGGGAIAASVAKASNCHLVLSAEVKNMTKRLLDDLSSSTVKKGCGLLKNPVQVLTTLEPLFSAMVLSTTTTVASSPRDASGTCSAGAAAAVEEKIVKFWNAFGLGQSTNVGLKEGSLLKATLRKLVKAKKIETMDVELLKESMSVGSSSSNSSSKRALAAAAAGGGKSGGDGINKRPRPN